MSYWPWLDFFRSATSIILLSVGSIQDIRSREIDDRIWIAFSASALLLNSIGVLKGSADPFWWPIFAGLQSMLFISLYYAGVYGGADAKALICLSIMYPSGQTDFLVELSSGRLPVALSAMNNALALTVLYLPANLLWNLAAKLKGVELFKGLEGEGFLRKVAALMLLRKIGFSKCCIENNKFMLAERKGEDGIRKIVFSRRLDGNSDERAFDPDEHVFASFLMPLQVLILLGLVMRLFHVDVILTLSLLIVGRLIG